MPTAHDPSCDCFGCKARSVSFGKTWAHSRDTVIKEKDLPKRDMGNQWEKGKAKIDGVPLLDANLQPVGIKQYTEQRHQIHESLAKAKAQNTTL